MFRLLLNTLNISHYNMVILHQGGGGGGGGVDFDRDAILKPEIDLYTQSN